MNLGIWRIDAVHRHAGECTLFREHEEEAQREAARLRRGGWRCDVYVELFEHHHELYEIGAALVLSIWPNVASGMIVLLARQANRQRKEERGFRLSAKEKAAADLAALRQRTLVRTQAAED